MPRFSEDTETFPMRVWKVREQHLTTVPKVLADAVKKGVEVKGTFEIKFEAGKIMLVLKC